MKQKKILIMDDEPLIIEILVSLFEGHGWTVCSATNGAEGLKLISNFNPTVILSDINMPEMDGLELLERVFKMGLNTPVILLTGVRDAKRMQRAWESCVYDFLDKPFEDQNLLDVAGTAHQYGEEYVVAARKRAKRIRGVTAAS